MPKSLNIDAIVRYGRLLRRNREIERIVKRLRGVQRRNGLQALRLVLTDEKLERIHLAE